MSLWSMYSLICVTFIGIFLSGCKNSTGPDDDERFNALQKGFKITEIHYHPMDEGTTKGNLFEFIELKNTGASRLDLSNVAFTNGITYAFPPGATLKPGAFIVLARNAAEFKNRYEFSPFGEYTGKLKNSGERLALSFTKTNRVIIDMKYDDTPPWPLEADGTGYSLVSTQSNPTGNPSDVSYWQASKENHGSPGKDDG